MATIAIGTLKSIYEIHFDLPCQKYGSPYVKQFMYHPSFLCWVYRRILLELNRRPKKTSRKPLPSHIESLKSRPLCELLPPTDLEIAQDVVYYLETLNKIWKPCLPETLLPVSYLHLAEERYGYKASDRACQGIDFLSKRHYHIDRGWYFLESKEEAKFDLSFVETYLRGGSYEG